MDDLILLEPREDLDQFIEGIGTGFGGEIAVVYNKDRLLEFWAKQYMKEESDLSLDDAYHMAVEWFEFNTIGAYVGPHTPIYISKDELEIFLQDYALKPDEEPSSTPKEQTPSLKETFESMSNAEADIWLEAFSMAQTAEFNLEQGNWETLLETFVKASAREHYLRSRKRWEKMRKAYPQAFEESGQMRLDLESSEEVVSELEKNIEGWKENLSWREKTQLIDTQFKRDLVRVFESAMK